MSTLGRANNADRIQRTPQPVKPAAGLWIADLTARRLIEGIAIQLNLVPALLEEVDLSSDRLFSFEMIIADADFARRAGLILKARQKTGEGLKPALVAIVPAHDSRAAPYDDPGTFDAILPMPQKPATISAQLGVALYSYRAFARRHQSAMDELHLNWNIFKLVTSGITVTDALLPDLPLMYVNPAFERMTGYSLEEIRGRNCRFLQGEDRDQPGLTLIREGIAHQRETIAVLKNYRKDGSMFWSELVLSPIRNREGVVTHIVGIQKDVTDRVEFEIALRESEKLAAVGRLASSIAHEINNPLEAVMNLVYLSQHALPEIEETAVSRRHLSRVDLELQRIKLVTAQSLRFYKQSNGPEAVRCEELLTSILDIYAPRMVNFGIVVERQERFAEHIVCVASEVRQVLSNLVSNAIDAMRNRGGRLLVRTREATSGTGTKRGVMFTIADTGYGMSSKTQASIYKAFFTTKGAAGTGLGLWISSDIVKRHQGYLRVRSRTGPLQSGTVFQLFLPFQAGETGYPLGRIPSSEQRAPESNRPESNRLRKSSDLTSEYFAQKQAQ